MKDHYLDSVLRVIASVEAEGRHLITVDELRAAGALDVPPAWRKSLGSEVQRDLFSGLIDGHDERPQNGPASNDPDSHESADDLP